MTIDPTRRKALSEDMADRIRTHKSAEAALKAARLERGMFKRRSKAKTALWLDELIPGLEREARIATEQGRRRHDLRRKWRDRRLKIAARYLTNATTGTDDLGDDEAEQNELYRILINSLEGGALNVTATLRQLLRAQGPQMGELLDLCVEAGDDELSGPLREGFTITNRNRLARQVQALDEFRKRLADMW